jgi:predicted small metal-binding protein
VPENAAPRAIRRAGSGRYTMKEIDCGKVNPASGCDHVIRAATEEEALQKAREHAKSAHGMDMTPELMEKVRGAIQDR